MGAATICATDQKPEFYVWSFPGAPVRVRLSLEVVQRMGEHLKLEPLPDGGFAPKRGLLLGNVDKAGNPEVTDFLPLFTPELTELEGALTSLGNSEGLRPLGYYRTHSEEQMSLAPDDLGRAQTFFPQPHCVFLLIRPLDLGRDASAGFFFWDGGRINGDFCFLEFPFDAPLLAAAEQCKATTDLQTPISPTAIENPPGEPPSIPDSNRKDRRFWGALTLSLAAMLIAMAGLAAGIFLSLKLPWTTDTPRSPDITPIALRVDRRGKDLVITWNHSSPLVTTAVTGRLTIYDGGSHELPLDKYNIRSGSVVYSPLTDQVRVQLDLQTPDQRVTSESVGTILTQPGTADQSVAPPTGIQPQLPLPPAAFDTESAGAGSQAGTPPARPKVLPTRQFVPPQDRASAPLQPPELTPPPAVTARDSPPAAVLLPAPTVPHSQPAPKAIQTTEQPQAATEPPQRLSPVDASNSDYVPPVPIRQVAPPPLTPFQRSLISRAVVIQIKVFIDASGKVRKTDRLSQANPVLATAAESVAKLWTFRPARKAGQAVPGEMILQFKFDVPK